MITEVILNMFVNTTIFMLKWIPIITIPADFMNSIFGVVELLAVVSYFMPIGILQLALGVFITFHSLEFIMSLVNWIIAKIPTID